MKRVILLLALFPLLFGCKGKKTMEFCEGVSTKGQGVNCGEIFSTGELTLLIKAGAPFGVSKLNIFLYKKGKYKSEKLESIAVEVKPDDATAKTNFYFYDEGDFIIEVIGQENKKIAEGSIRIIDEQ